MATESMHKLVKFGCMVFELCECIQTDAQTNYNTSQLKLAK